LIDLPQLTPDQNALRNATRIHPFVFFVLFVVTLLSLAVPT
jgi:hypothetical protein